MYLIIYCTVYIIKNKQYTSNKFKTIGIGNLTIGGAGKTPTAIYIAQELQQLGYKVAFFSSGYGGNFNGTVITNKKHSADIIGDEASILQKYAPTVISKDKLLGLKACESLNVDFVIIDDALQNPTIKKDINLLVIDNKYRFGNGLLLPAGPLRETMLLSKHKINAAIIIHRDDNNHKKLNLKLNNIFNLRTCYHHTLDTNQNYLAFTAIAKAEKFYDSLKQIGINTVITKSFLDHYQYTNADINDLQNIAKKHSLKIVTTQKDIVKIDTNIYSNIEVLDISLKEEKPTLIQFILHTLR